MKPFSALFVLCLSAAVCQAYYSSYWNKPPITLCMKEDFSICVNVTYPSDCVDLDTIPFNFTYNGTVYFAANNVESVIVSDVDDEASRCIVLFDTYTCQGTALVLNASTRASANLYKNNFANRARSIRPCTDRLLNWLSNNPNEVYANNEMPVSALNSLMFPMFLKNQPNNNE